MRSSIRRTALIVFASLLSTQACKQRSSALVPSPDEAGVTAPGSGSSASPPGSGSNPPTGGGSVGGTSPGPGGPVGAPGPVEAPVLVRTLPGSWDEGWLAAPALVDLDGDGKLDVVAARHSVLQAWRADGTTLWRTAFGKSAAGSPARGNRRMWASPIAADFDGDGDVEIAVASDVGSDPDANVALYDHHGALLPGWPRKFGSTEIRSIAAADVDGDGKLEVLLNKLAEGPSTTVLGLDGEQRAGWPQVSASCHPAPPSPPCFDFGGYNQNIGAADLDADGRADVVTTYDMMGFGIFHGDGRPFPAAPGFADLAVSGVEAYHDYALAKQGWGVGDRSEFTDSPPAIADLDGDGDLEVILVGNHEHSESTASRGYTLFVFNRDASRPAGWEQPKDTGAPLRTEAEGPGHNIILTMPSPAVGQLDGTGGLEIVFPGYDGKLYAFGADGQQRWELSVGSGWPYVGLTEPLIADVNGDGASEVIFATWSSGTAQAPEAASHLYVVSAQGAVLHQVQLPGRGSMAAPSLGDLEGDGTLELVVSLKDAISSAEGGVQIWRFPNSRADRIEWGTARGNWQRTGQR